ncbi:unannotated protein [freshwater metagenome]|uniref:Unannotated protein n=1 Tax=freshwater metagenome TaxID=449393 RepID=A0A6J7JBZ8_9ZZZZ
MEEFDVIISGYGPTGISAASLIARMGHSVAVFERWPTMYGLPRLCSIDGESCRIVQAAGDVDQALADHSDVKWYHLVDGEGNVLIDVNFEKEKRVSGFYNRKSMYQPDVERAMDEAGRERGVQVFQGYELKAFEQDADGVTVTVEKNMRRYEGPQEDPKQYRAKYLIGADGANSIVRKVMKPEMDDYGFREGFLSVDVMRKGDYQFASETSTSICDPKRPISVIPIGNNRMRFEFLIDPDEDNTELLTPDVGYHFLESAWGITKDDVEIYRQVLYPFEAKVMHNWRQGRAFLAGDAAHQMPPFQGQGACSGMRDSINLAWKLDLVLRGLADEDLLDLYTEERRPHVTKVTVDTVEIGKVACTRDEKVIDELSAFLKSGGELPPPPTMPNLDFGILHRASGEVDRPAGLLGPQGPVEKDGVTGRFDDVVGWGFQLIVAGTDPLADLSDEHREFLAQINCVAANVGDGGDVKPLDAEYMEYFATHGVMGVLVRPDYYVFAGIRSLDELPAIIDDLRGQLKIKALAPA